MAAHDSVFHKIAEALLMDYSSLYYVNAVTNAYQWYTNDPDTHTLHAQIGGDDFFSYLTDHTKHVVYEADQHIFLRDIQKEKLLAQVGRGSMQSIEYRLMIDGKPVWHSLRLLRGLSDSDDYFILGVSNIDETVRKRDLTQRMEREREIYNQIASRLAAHYDTLYYIDMETGRYFEVSSNDFYKRLNVPAAGEDFFAETRKNVGIFVHPDDREYAMRILDKAGILEHLATQSTYTAAYRLLTGDTVTNVRCSQMWASDRRHVIIGLENINNEVSTLRELAESRRKNQIYGQIAESLASQYDVIYYVDMRTASFIGFTANAIFGKLEVQEEGEDFFAVSKMNSELLVHPEDRRRFQEMLTPDYLISSLEERKQCGLDYRMIVDGKQRYTRMTIMWSSDRIHMIVGVEDVHAEVEREQEQLHALHMANELARRDELTGIKNKTAFHELEEKVRKSMGGEEQMSFAMVVCDLNDLKHVNDTLGHHAGDEFIRSACRIICEIFAHSPVFRIGGDEFVAFLSGNDYNRRDVLFAELRARVEENRHVEGAPVIASGMAVYDPGTDRYFSDVFERADQEMYENKKNLKSERIHA